MESIGMQINKELIGNLIVLLAEKCTPLYHTKLIKMLYLIDEEAVKDSGIPITWLDYKLWKSGPVDPAIFNIRDTFKDYVSAQKEENITGDTHTVIIPKKKFEDDEFSEYDMEIINRIIETHKNDTASDLLSLTNAPGSLWDITRKENDIAFSISDFSDVSIDMKRLVEEDKQKYTNYIRALDNACFSLYLKKRSIGKTVQ